MRGGQIHLVINFKYRAVLTPTFETSISDSNLFGTTQPIKKVTKNPPNISNTPPKIESTVPRIFKFNAEGMPAKNRKRVIIQTDFSLLKPNLSINEETGTSNNETDEVMAAI